MRATIWLPLLAIGGLLLAGSMNPPGMVAGSNSGGWMPIAVSLVVLGAALYVVLSRKFDEADRKWAYGAVGTILGYWLRFSVS